MATMIRMVERAYRKIAVAGTGEALEPDYVYEGLDTLNMMLHEWKLHGIDISHTDLVGSAAFPLGPEFELGTVYLLAEKLAPNYMIPRSFSATEFFEAIRRTYVVIDPVDIPTALTYPPSRWARIGTSGLY